MTVTVISQAPADHLAISAGAKPAQAIQRILIGSRLRIRTDTSTRRAGKSSLYVQSFQVRSQDAAALSSIAKAVALLPWPVANISSQGEFVAVKRGRAILWQLRSSTALTGKSVQSSIQIDGPSVIPGYADYLALLLLAALVVSFGSLERNNQDPAAFPRGLHPFVVFWQMLLAGMLVCWTLICIASQTAGLAVSAIACLCAISLARWALIAKISVVFG